MGICRRTISRGRALARSLRTNGYFPTCMRRLMRKVCVWVKRGERHLIWLVRDVVTLTFSLSLQTLILLLSAAVVLVLSLLSLMLIPIVLVLGLISLRTRISRRS